MAPARYTPGRDDSRGANSTPPLHASASPRRRSVAIHDLLNPVGGDDGSGLREWPHGHGPGGHDEGRRRRQSSFSSSFHRAPRHGSPMSSSGRPSPPRERERRGFRPTYSVEEADFIWYHRDDLGWQWHPILEAFKSQFPNSSTTRDVGGIQCKYYRHLEGEGLPQVRQRRTVPAQEYYMRAFTGRRYPWMG